MESSHIKRLGVAMHWNIWSLLVLKISVAKYWNIWSLLIIKKLGVAMIGTFGVFPYKNIRYSNALALLSLLILKD